MVIRISLAPTNDGTPPPHLAQMRAPANDYKRTKGHLQINLS
jgi:hypothetical protein